MGAGLGIEVSAPAKLWGYLGNTCGDADGDGKYESLKSLVLTVDGQIALFGQYSILGKKRWDWIDWKKDIAGWKAVKVTEFTRGKGDFYALQYPIMAKEFMPPANSALTPMLIAPNPMPNKGAGISASMRSCVPNYLKQRMEYTVDFGDGSKATIAGDGGQPIIAAHNWGSNLGEKSVKVSIQSNGARQGFSTSKKLTVAELKTPSIPGDLQAKSLSSTAFTLSWASVTGDVQSYEVEQQDKAGAWKQVASQLETSLQQSNLAAGQYQYRVRSCNAASCSGYTTPLSIKMGRVDRTKPECCFKKMPWQEYRFVEPR